MLLIWTVAHKPQPFHYPQSLRGPTVYPPRSSTQSLSNNKITDWQAPRIYGESDVSSSFFASVMSEPSDWLIASEQFLTAPANQATNHAR